MEARQKLSPGESASIGISQSDRASGEPASEDETDGTTLGDHEFFPGDYSRKGLIGRSLPGSWRPFSYDSPWNTPIPADARTHLDSANIMALAVSEAKHIRLTNIYNIPIWLVNSRNMPLARVWAAYPFPLWDQDHDRWADVGVPLSRDMYGEPTGDGHICIIDPFKMVAWEMSHFRRVDRNAEDNGGVDHRIQRSPDFPTLKDGTPTCSTFNVWDLTGNGMADPHYEGWRWQTRGGRGSGFPVIAGMVRPEEVLAGEIRHALVFTFSHNRKSDAGPNAQVFLPPACRSDGQYEGEQYPVEGMRFQLDPSLTEVDFERWGLTRERQVLARALQKCGMFPGDNGGAMALQA